MQPLRSGSPSSSPGSRLRREPRSPFPVLLPVVSGSPFRARRVPLRRTLVLLVAEEGPHLALVDEGPVVGDVVWRAAHHEVAGPRVGGGGGNPPVPVVVHVGAQLVGETLRLPNRHPCRLERGSIHHLISSSSQARAFRASTGSMEKVSREKPPVQPSGAKDLDPGRLGRAAPVSPAIQGQLRPLGEECHAVLPRGVELALHLVTRIVIVLGPTRYSLLAPPITVTSRKSLSTETLASWTSSS